MHQIKIRLFMLAIICVTCHIQSNSAFAQLRWFDSYTHVTSKEERFHLDNFAYYLKNDLKLTGYIGYFVGKNDKGANVKRRALKAREYLIKEYSIPKSRIVLIYGGKKAETEFVLQPKISSEPPPKLQIE